MVFLKYIFFEKGDFEKISKQQKSMEKFPGGKELMVNRTFIDLSLITMPPPWKFTFLAMKHPCVCLGLLPVYMLRQKDKLLMIPLIIEHLKGSNLKGKFAFFFQMHLL